MNTEGNNKDINVEAKTINEIQSESILPSGRYGPLVARIPVIISQSKVHISINTEISLDDSAVDIRNFKRSVHLNQCSLLDMGDKRHGKVYLSGYIDESIEYTAFQSIDDKSSTKLCFKTVKIPFDFAAKIEYCTRPSLLISNKFISVSLSSSLNQSSTKECLLCQLDEADIYEADIIKKSMFSKDSNTFDTITEYLVLYITFTILQWQQVSIPRGLPYNSP